MAKKVKRFLITYTDNLGQRRSLTKEFKKRSDAVKELKRLLAPGKLNVPGDERTRRTAPRYTVSNYGFNNPRIKEVMLYR